MEPNKKEEPLTFKVAQGLNRHQRRRLGKDNGVKIPGTEKPIIKWIKRNRYRWEGKGPMIKVKAQDNDKTS